MVQKNLCYPDPEPSEAQKNLCYQWNLCETKITPRQPRAVQGSTISGLCPKIFILFD